MVIVYELSPGKQDITFPSAMWEIGVDAVAIAPFLSPLGDIDSIYQVSDYFPRGSLDTADSIGQMQGSDGVAWGNMGPAYGKSDFSNWVRDVIGDGTLANQLQKAMTETTAARKVEVRLDWLKARL